jgi:hypothetical protein
MFRRRIITSAGRALGASLLRDVALASVRRDLDERPEGVGPLFGADALCAMDQLAGWAASTDPALVSRTPGSLVEPRSVRARRALIELAGVPDLTPWALARLPFHRLDHIDREALRELVRIRDEVFPEAWVDDGDNWATIAVELSLLQALDAADQGRLPLGFERT